MIFPWQQKQWQQLQQAQQTDRLPHALLLLGMAGIGKTSFAQTFIRAQRCEQAVTQECECKNCSLIKNKIHPNLLWIEPEKNGGLIKVDQIREVSEFINQTSLQGDMRFVVIHPANNMNANAANALLKTLEEPAPEAMLILISDQSAHLPATILSRCQHIHFSKPPHAQALTWLSSQGTEIENPDLLLRLANGAPLTALQYSTLDIISNRLNIIEIITSLRQPSADPLAASATIQAMDSIQVLDFLLTWVMDLLRLRLGAQKQDLVNSDFVEQLADLQSRISLKSMLLYMNYLQQVRAQLNAGLNLNKQLMIETIFIRWMECV
jgi:DNA polymerase-3 subunit delta'